MSVYESVANIAEPDWMARKEEFDSYDDGCGPCDDWGGLRDEPEATALKQAWVDFQAWAKDHLGQGYSLACCDGWFVDITTSWAYRGFVAGRGIKR